VTSKPLAEPRGSPPPEIGFTRILLAVGGCASPNHPPGALPLDSAGGLPFPGPPVPPPPNPGYATV